jgi:asparagine synthase (glutamine-hydrolysing)
MCGIAGVLYFDHRPVDRGLLRAMGDSIAHRGPDSEGFFATPGLGLVHRRLSIIDLKGGDQPIANEDNSIQIVFNGEIYNYAHLRTNLQQAGHRFATNSDTETLVHLYEDHGSAMAQSLRGMFAFALWDGPSRSLVLGRDRLGQKPLYYYQDQDKFVFGSEIRAILAHGDVKNVLDLESVDMYLSLGMVPGARSIYRDIRKLPPAHTLTIDQNGKLRLSRFWKYGGDINESLSSNKWQEAVREKIEDAVQSHLVSDVPVGAFLSGGIDSTIVSSVAARQSPSPLQTFSIGFSNGQNSELPVARETSDRIGGVHRQSIVHPDAAADLDRLVEVYDEPFADSSAIPTMRVAELAAQHVKVVLSGDGGDECFGGYARYRHDLTEARIRAMLPETFRAVFLRPLARLWPQADWLPRFLRGKSILTNLSSAPSLAYAQTLSNCTHARRQNLYSAEMRRALNGFRPESELARTFQLNDRDPLRGMLAADFSCLLPDAFLVKVDRASMAVGLEVRPPLLDHELVELAATIPSEFKIRNGQTKWILKQSMRSHLPASLLKLPKQGFEIPLDSWFRGPLADVFRQVSLASNGLASQIFHVRSLKSLIDGHVRGTKHCGQLLWNILVLSRWLERYRPQLPC